MNNKRFLCCAVILLQLSISCDGKDNAGLFHIENEFFDCGIISSAERVATHTFKITNNGTMPLIIEEITTSCSCTVAKYPHKLLPGESGDIHLRFTLANKLGPQTTSALVKTSDPKHSRVVLGLKAQLEVDFDITTEKLRFDTMETGKMYKKEFKVITPEKLGSVNPTFSSTTPNIAIENVCHEKVYTQWDEKVLITTYSLVYDARQRRAGSINEAVLVKLGDQSRTINVIGKVITKVRIDPESFYFSNFKNGEKRCGCFLVSGLESENMVKSILTTSNSITITSKTYEHNLMKVNFCIDLKTRDKSFIDEQITVLLNDDLQNQLTVAILGAYSSDAQ
jgi:hypothetical protein